MLRTIVFLGIVAVCAFMAGWFTIQRDDKQTTIRFNREEIRADASKAIEKGRELLDKNLDENLNEKTDQDSIFGEASFSMPEVHLPFEGASNEAAQQAARSYMPWQQESSSNSGGQF